MRTSEDRWHDSHKTKEAGSDASSLFDPRQFLFLLEDPHDNGPQEHEDTAYGEKLELSHHGSPPSLSELELCLKSAAFSKG